MENSNFDRFYKLRKQSGKSQEEIADQLGISRQALSKWENGESFPTTENLIALAKVYDVSMDELVGNAVEEKRDILVQKTKRNSSNIYMIAAPMATILFFLTLALFPKFSVPWIWFLFIPVAGGLSKMRKNN